MEICKNIQSIRENLKDHTTLVAVSKTFPSSFIREAFQCFQYDFGESRVQELLFKQKELQDLSVRWHFIGNLQSNKLGKLAGNVFLIHSLSSSHLYDKLDEVCRKKGVIQPVLLQVNISKEPQKGGFLPEEILDFLMEVSKRSEIFVPVHGLMCIASDPAILGMKKVEAEYACMQDLYTKAKNSYFGEAVCMKHLSMGMSSDWQLALLHGATIIRVGSMIFGGR